MKTIIMKGTGFKTLSITSDDYDYKEFDNIAQDWKIHLKLTTAKAEYFYVENNSNLETCSEEIYESALNDPLLFTMELVCKSIQSLYIKKYVNHKDRTLNFPM
jgi:hypothetical protein